MGMNNVYVRAYMVAAGLADFEDGAAFDPQWETCNDDHSYLERLQKDPTYYDAELVGTEDDGYWVMSMLSDRSLRGLRDLLNNACTAAGVIPLSDYMDYHAYDPENPYGHREDTASPKEGIKTLDTVLRTLCNLGEENDLIRPDHLDMFIEECEDCKRRLHIIDAAGMTFLLRVVDLSLV